MTNLYILCEGQTECYFINKVLSDYLWVNLEITTIPIIVQTSSEQKGGITSYSKAKNDLLKLLKWHSGYDGIFTTMFDLYGLPPEFPGYNKKHADHLIWVHNIENAFSNDIGDKRFIPYIQLHEFETLVLCNIKGVKNICPDAEKPLDKLQDEIKKFFGGKVEKVNNNPSTAPSKRLINAFKSANHNYNKTIIGPKVAAEYGIDNLRKQCSHFDEWITAIEERTKKLNI